MSGIDSGNTNAAANSAPINEGGEYDTLTCPMCGDEEVKVLPRHLRGDCPATPGGSDE